MKPEINYADQFFLTPQEEEKRQYYREYQAKYRQCPIVRDYDDCNNVLAQVLRRGQITEHTRERLKDVVGCDYEFLINHLGLDNEAVMTEFRNGEYEIDHVISRKWFREHPHLSHYMNHWRNLVIRTKEENRKKGSMVNIANDPAVILLMLRMKIARLKTDISRSFPDADEYKNAIKHVFGVQ